MARSPLHGRAAGEAADEGGHVPVSLLLSPVLSGSGFRHAFTTRASGDFATLRDPTLLRDRQEALAHDVGFARAAFYQTKQVHGRAVVVAGGRPEELLGIEADAIIGEPGTGHAVAVRVADCVPVLVADRSSGRVAAVHAGWRGVEAEIVSATLERVAGDKARAVAAIGPCIGACCFEVGGDVAERISRAAGAAVVVRREGDKAFVDLRRAVRAQLVRSGVAEENVDDVGGCTRCDAARFHSYRRDGDASGRLVGVIVAR